MLASTVSTDRATASEAILGGINALNEAHRSLADPGYMGMWLTTSARHGHSMGNARMDCQNSTATSFFCPENATKKRSVTHA